MDMLNGSLGRKILLFSLPLVLTGILQQLFNAADIVVVGQFVGKEAMAAVGGNAPAIGLLVGLFVGLSMGSNVVIANLIGKNSPSGIAKAVDTSILSSLIIGALLTAAGEYAVPEYLSVMSLP
ncbi:MAG: MATE family efflux transporter, partial [Mailhella sp.]|nr:MATE family efflux transporter [Mailhella sp.]